MSFMYKTMLNRAPNKRKIKINEENILRLITTSEEEDEEDEDFVIPDQKEEEDKDESESDDTSGDGSEEDDGDEDETNKNDDSTDTDESPEPAEQISKKQKSAPSSSYQKIKPPRRRRKKSIGSVAGPTVQDVSTYISSEYSGLPAATVDMLVQAKKQLKQSEKSVQNLDPWATHLCGVCLEEKSFKMTKKLVACSKCGTSVHEDCYNMPGKVQKKGDSHEPWLCDSCIEGNEKVCEFCPNTWGCMKETKCGRWVHIVCARNILADYLHNASMSSPKKSPRSKATIYIQLTDHSNKLYGSKECILCEDRLVAKTGVCIKCDAGFCKSTFHVTCAQRHGLLFRASGGTEQNNNGEAYYANCPLHCDKEDMKKRQRNFILQRKNANLKRNKFENSSFVDRNTVSGRLIRLREAKQRQRDIYMPPKPPLEQVPRLLSGDAHFTRLLNDKAEQMFGITTKSPATIIPRPTEVRKRHHVVPSLTTDFAAYYADRQLRVEEEQCALASAVETNRKLSEKQEWERHKYNEIRGKLIQSKFEHTDLKTNLESLKRYFLSLHQWATTCSPAKPGSKKKRVPSANRLKLPNPLVPIFNHSQVPVDEFPLDDTPSTSTQGFSMNIEEQLPDADAIIELRSCGICKKQQNQHLLVKCDVCHEWQHLGCLDPPLTQMPKRTKYSLWQCSECASSSGSSSSDCDTATHGSFTNDDGRRLTRRSHKAPDKLVNNILDSHGRIRSRTKMGPQARLKANKQQQIRNEEREVKRSRVMEMNSELETVEASPAPVRQVAVNEREELSPQSPATDPTLVDQPTSPSPDLPLGVSCDNYLSQAARIPIMSDPTTPTAAFVGKKFPNVIVLKKPICIPPRRPSGLGKVKDKPVTSPGTKPVITSLTPAALSQPGTSGLAKFVFKDNTYQPKKTFYKITKLVQTTPKERALHFKPKTSPKAVSPPQAPPQKTKPTPENKPPTIPVNIPVPIKPEKPPSKPQECSVCKKTEDLSHMVTCDTCKKTYHWHCCSPPIKANPKKLRFILWECSDCVDERDSDDDGSVKTDNIQDRGFTVTPDGRKSITRKRKPPDVFEPAFMVSDQQRIFKTLERKKLKKYAREVESADDTFSAARCKPIDQQPAKTKITPKLPAGLGGTPHSIWIGRMAGNTTGLETLSIVRKSAPGTSPVFNLVSRPRKHASTIFTLAPAPPSPAPPVVDLTANSEQKES